MSGTGRTAPDGVLRPVCGPGGSGAGLLPPSSERQSGGQEALQRADPGHGPDVRQRPDGSGRSAAPPCVAPGGRVLVCSPKLREARAAARRPTSGPIRATARMSGTGQTAPGGALCPRAWPWWLGAGLCPPAPRGQSDGQEAHRRADLGHGPDVRHRPGSSGRCASVCGPCGLGATDLLPQFQGAGQRPGGPSAGRSRATGRMSGRDWAVPGGTVLSPIHPHPAAVRRRARMRGKNRFCLGPTRLRPSRVRTVFFDGGG